MIMKQFDHVEWKQSLQDVCDVDEAWTCWPVLMSWKSTQDPKSVGNQAVVGGNVRLNAHQHDSDELAEYWIADVIFLAYE